MKVSKEFVGNLIVLLGPTASGKTKVAIQLAKHFGTEIISADSRQFYKEIPIGTAAPTREEQSEVEHHMVGNISIIDNYNVSKFEHDVLDLLNSKFSDKDVVVLTGGSGLYVDAVCKGIDELPDIDESVRIEVKNIYDIGGLIKLQEKLKIIDPLYYDIVDLKNPMRLMRAIETYLQTGMLYSNLRKNKPALRKFNIIKIGLNIPREELVSRINRRVDTMIDMGWIDEAQKVFKYKDLNSLNTVGYKEIFSYFENNMTLENAIEKIKTSTRRYAKRQMTWFRRDKDIQWFDPENINGMVKLIKQY